jgi:hypothetical protein
MKITWAAAMLCAGLACQAQTVRPDTSPTVPQRGGEPLVQRLVSEDDLVRIEELRVRGMTRRLTVQPKLPGVPAYQIGPNGDGRDAAQQRPSDGRALWQLFAF